jgi:hypothetical protein
MIVAYDLRGILAYGQEGFESDVLCEAMTYWDGKTPFRISIAQATPALEALIAQEGGNAGCGECRDGRLGTIAETPSAALQGAALPIPGRMEAPMAKGPTSFSRRHDNETVTISTEDKSK